MEVDVCDVRAIAATVHMFCAANTLCRIIATKVSCTMHRSALITSEVPICSCSICESTMFMATNAKPKPTLDQSSCGLDGDGGALSIRFWFSKKEEKERFE